ncbi:ATP-binding protein [Algoriphagus winogradskyi]|uniref:AAA ATPase domain-containing protein n=1 Tax=Algoriphagus winogradskyi TaxID=237017 RepID=A0ABY1NE29_9BACT|nr:ATP-binding protein [Algoriphagus winogradskyi]SMP06659.1 AAA ATPase domain-containing protein [Algoriphagus winogradskyi]
MKKYPFKFLDSYQREDRNVFFGRDEEIKALYEMVFQSATVLVYGASGTGKTSLINCGLAGKFQPHDWLDLKIRRGSDINKSLKSALEKAGGKVNLDFDESNYLDEWEIDADNSNQQLTPISKSIRAVYQKNFRPVYLIFDQFEELFILGSLTEQQILLETIQGILKSGQPVKLIFSIREEYLGYLFDFERAIPQLFRKKLRVEPMNLDKVKQVIIGATAYEGSNISIKEGEEDAVAEAIFHKIKGDKKSLTIQLPFLQVFLDKLYLNITGDKRREKPAEFTSEKVNEMGRIGDILSNFLEEQVADISKELNGNYPTLNSSIIWKILSPFATLEGTKDPITKDELFDRLPDLDQKMVNDVVEVFSNSRLLRYNENTDTFEISHDSLAKPIAERRSVEETSLLEVKRLIRSQVGVNEEAREYFTEKQLIYIEPSLKKLKLSEEELNWIEKSRDALKKEKQREAKQKYDDLVKSKKSMFLKVAVGVFVVIAGLFILIAFKAQKSANDALEAGKAVTIEKNYSDELIRLLLEGKGDQYENLSEDDLKGLLEMERVAPIDSLVEIRASVSPSNTFSGGKKNYNFTFWLELPSFRKNEIKEVRYNFCKGFYDSIRTSRDQTSSFSIGYLGWGVCDTIRVDIVLENGITIREKFPFKEYISKRLPIE